MEIRPRLTKARPGIRGACFNNLDRRSPDARSLCEARGRRPILFFQPSTLFITQQIDKRILSSVRWCGFENLSKPSHLRARNKTQREIWWSKNNEVIRT